MVKVIINQDTCIGCGACEATCDEVYVMNDNGKAECKNGKDSMEVKNEKCAKEGADVCPVDAIKVE